MARLAIRVAGGTGAGCRTPPTPVPGQWTCENGHVNKGAWTRCLTAGCNVRRPKP
jgi:hypothetical protein